ncbi:sarcosine oxidase subunit alpha family protein [Phreatobacter sp.]|uniref:sarcosine oxidase subunit alpha family protein n=1 Tax=Phreatobacter sp. TaxID=1966341 RepID=UPI0022C0918A|nr:sarcosine oxidase subunit alpha family protein [Phreatobacter sp.]MCZ8316932.1 sarcosine oxidase subunit alpha family protein [Phreatobacter sp.]
MTSHRLASGGLIDRATPIGFSFDGRPLTGHAGDTLASALVANGIRLVGRSFKYHRPRGIVSAGPEEPNALVEKGRGPRREPNTRATTIELHPGLDAASQNRWPSLAFDIQAIAQFAAPILGAGFYYKTFMWPAALWERLYEPAIRRAAGLGRLSGAADPDAYEKAHAFCDLLVIGAGPAGLAAALTAGRAGARVILVDQDFRLGGRLLCERVEVDAMPGPVWAGEVEAELKSLSNVRILTRTSAFGLYDGEVGAVERLTDHLPVTPAGEARQRLWTLVPKRILLAAGAIERPIVFGGNDRPGVMLASAMRTYVERYAALPGRQVALFTTTDDGWQTAASFARAGSPLAAIIDARREVPEAVRALAGDVPVFLGARVLDAIGGQSLRAIDIVGDHGRRRLAVDGLAVSGGFNPDLALTTHLGHKPVWSDERAAFIPGDLPANVAVAGAAAGRFTLAAALADGARLGAEAAREAGHTPAETPAFRAGDEPCAVAPLFHVEGGRGKAFVDLQNDVTDSDVALAAREGFVSVEHLKRYTTLGMATDQGRTSSVNGLAILAALTGRTIPETGTTRARPPHVPVAIGALAGLHRGRDFKPTRLTPAHGWAKEQGAIFVESGPWLRAQWFPKAGETDWLQSVTREVEAVRAGVGICDVSTLGKIALSGPDVGTFLDRVYANTFSTLPVGKVRYGLMLREDGFVMDDGTTARLGPDEWVMSTTTANAGKVMQHLAFCHQVLWPELDVQMVSVTEQWAQFAVAGPRSRDLLEALFGPEADVSDAALPYLGCTTLALGPTRARLFRISFSGERAYEIAVPAGYGDALARALMAAGRDLGVTPYGTEALAVMRIEKGHVAGAELNGQTVARDLGLGRMLSKKKDYVGRLMAERAALNEASRPTLVGLKPTVAGVRLRSGAHVLPLGVPPTAEHDQGYVTSTAYSPTLGSWIALALVANGPARHGEEVRIHDPVRSGDVVATIVSPVFVDPEGARLHG